jgi:hypothetical protein
MAAVLLLKRTQTAAAARRLSTVMGGKIVS